jgi:phenylalanyl-tRNA synthetase alpha chain
MIRKNIRDIRLLRSTDPRVIAQMEDLTPYLEVSSMPPVIRDISLVIDERASLEDIGDRVREALLADAGVVENVEILSQTRYDDLPPAAIKRLGMSSTQKNVLLRIVLRALERTLTAAECNAYRDAIYGALNEGSEWHWAGKDATR